MSSITATTTNPVEISSFYSHLSMMPLVGHGPKLPSNIYRPNSSSLWMDPAMQPFFYYNLALNDPNHKRKNATRETTATLKAWLYEHRKNPYPTKNEKMVLAMVTKMTLTQVSTWFANARRRLKKENKLHRITNNNNRTTGGKSEEDDEDDDEEEEEEDDETRYSSKESDVDIEEGDEQQQSIKINTHDNHLLYNENKSKNTNAAAVVVVSNLKRKCDDHNEDLAQPPAKIIAGNRPKIWSLVDVVQSNETTNRSSSHAITTPSIHYPLPSPARLVVPPLYPFVTPSPYLLYPPPNACLPTCLTSPSHSEHSTNSSSSSSSSPSSSSTTSCCSSTQTK